MFAQRTTLSGIDATDGGRDGNLRRIRRCRSPNSQHSRGFDAPARGRGGDLRHIPRRRSRNWQHSRGFPVPGREKADTIEELQSRAPNLLGFVGPLGDQVARFADGTRFWPRWTAKSPHIRDPGRPVCMRHAGSGAPDRKNPAQWWSGGAGGGRREATGARIRKKHLRNRHLSMVLEVEIVAVAPPARGRRPAALRPTVEPAYRTQSGRAGFQICRVSAVRRQRIGVYPTQSGRPAINTYRPTPSGECGIGSPTTAIFTANLSLIHI